MAPEKENVLSFRLNLMDSFAMGPGPITSATNNKAYFFREGKSWSNRNIPHLPAKNEGISLVEFMGSDYPPEGNTEWQKAEAKSEYQVTIFLS